MPYDLRVKGKALPVRKILKAAGVKCKDYDRKEILAADHFNSPIASKRKCNESLPVDRAW